MEPFVLVLACGGTFDKVYVPETYELGFPQATHIHEILNDCQVSNVEVRQLWLMDSLDMEPSHLAALARVVEEAEHDRMLVVTGTSRIESIAGGLVKHSAGKTIVLTGAYIPYSMKRSDASFNFGCALGAARTMRPGVFVSLRGRITSYA